MKKVLQIITASLVSVGLFAGVAAADSVTCGSISNTGAGSTNTVTCVDKNNKQVTCNNNVVVENTNDQSSSSGSAFTVGNTSGGSATSGNSSADNTVTVNLGASCAPTQVATTTTVTPPAGGKGAGAPAQAATTPAATTKVSAPALPETGSNDIQRGALIGVIVLGAAAATSRFVTLAIRRSALK